MNQNLGLRAPCLRSSPPMLQVPLTAVETARCSGEGFWMSRATRKQLKNHKLPHILLSCKITPPLPVKSEMDGMEGSLSECSPDYHHP